MSWYIIQAYSGFEKKVVESIKDELKKHKLADNLQEVLDILNKTGMCDNAKRGGKGRGLQLIDFKKQQKSLEQR